MDSDDSGPAKKSIKYPYWALKVLLIFLQLFSLIVAIHSVLVILYGAVVTNGHIVSQSLTITESVLVTVVILADLVGLVGSIIDKIALVILYGIVMVIMACICLYFEDVRAKYFLKLAVTAGLFAIFVKMKEVYL